MSAAQCRNPSPLAKIATKGFQVCHYVKRVREGEKERKRVRLPFENTDLKNHLIDCLFITHLLYYTTLLNLGTVVSIMCTTEC